MLQKTYIRIDETGAEAAAATDMTVLTSTGEKQPKKAVLDLNRPFLFGIVETSTGMLLFMGCQARF